MSCQRRGSIELAAPVTRIASWWVQDEREMNTCVRNLDTPDAMGFRVAPANRATSFETGIGCDA